MKHDPFTLRVALDNTGSARGELYLDDGESYQHHKGDFIWREFTAGKAPKKSRTLRIASRDLASQSPQDAVETKALSTYNAANAYATSLQNAGVRVERVVVLGLSNKPKSVTTEDGKALEWSFEDGVAAVGSKEGPSSVLTIKGSGLDIVGDWAILVE
jgi:alpha 1,3-glucosidase